MKYLIQYEGGFFDVITRSPDSENFPNIDALSASLLLLQVQEEAENEVVANIHLEDDFDETISATNEYRCIDSEEIGINGDADDAEVIEALISKCEGSPQNFFRLGSRWD